MPKADYTPPHESNTDYTRHATYRGSEHTVHAYGPDFKPWPVGRDDKWISKR